MLPETAGKPLPKGAPSAFDVTQKSELPGQLYFYTRSGWVGEVPSDQSALRVEFDNVCAVLRGRFQQRAPKKFDEEYSRLLSLAHATFSEEYAQVAEGAKSLNAYKDELIRQEGPAIKNEYLKELAISAAVASLIIFLVAALIRIGIYYGEQNHLIVTEKSSVGGVKVALSSIRWDVKYSPMHFGALLISTMWGIWLSFVVRNMDLRFEQLQHAESDLMRPWSRLLAFGLLAFALAMFFQMGILVISIGGVSTNQISEDLLVAIFVGLGLGFTDKALPERVRERFEEFFQSAKKG